MNYKGHGNHSKAELERIIEQQQLVNNELTKALTTIRDNFKANQSFGQNISQQEITAGLNIINRVIEK